MSRVRRMITLFDIASKLDPKPFSPNTWKTRLVLNYKNIAYKTDWLSYGTIESHIKALGGAPTGIRDDKPLYTLPVIADEDRVVSDSSAIADYLERTYPTPCIFPPGTRALQASFTDYLSTALLPALRPLIAPLTFPVIDDAAQAYFRRTREAQFGAALEDVFPVGSAQREQQWKSVALVLDRVAAWLDEAAGAGDGPWLGGAMPIYADFVLASHFIWLSRIPIPDGWSRVQQWNGGRWSRLLDACAPYMLVK